jgi:hypothetical protein
MRASGPLHPRRPDGSVLDATFELSVAPVYDLVFHHKAGGRDSPRSVNADYHEALEILLGRLGALGCSILAVSVDSTVARDLPPEDRELDLEYPLRIDDRTDPHLVRLRITRAQKSVARRPDAKPGGGNDQKRIRISFTLDQSADLPAVLQHLVRS